MSEQATGAEARSIHGDNGSYVLAPDEGAARSFASAEGYELGRDVGWMTETWDYDNYETRKEFLEESGYESWWMGCQPPQNGRPSEHVLRAWEAVAL